MKLKLKLKLICGLMSVYDLFLKSRAKFHSYHFQFQTLSILFVSLADIWTLIETLSSISSQNTNKHQAHSIVVNTVDQL